MINLLHELFGCTHFPARVPELVPDDLVLDKRSDKPLGWPVSIGKVIAGSLWRSSTLTAVAGLIQCDVTG